MMQDEGNTIGLTAELTKNVLSYLVALAMLFLTIRLERVAHTC